MMLKKGIIVSIQGYGQITTEELAKNAINAGCIAIRTDKPFVMTADKVPIIGLQKIKVNDVKKSAYITPDVENIAKIKRWADYVAIDYRQLNKNLPEISEYCKNERIKVVADIECYEDYVNIRDMGYHYTYISTTFAVFRLLFRPNLRLLKRILETEPHVIAEGNYSARADVAEAFKLGAQAVCIGGAISDVYKLTKKYTSIPT